MKKPMNQQNEAVKDEALLFIFEANNSPTTAHASEPKPETRDCLLVLLHRALWYLYIVHSPTIALFIKLGEV